MADRRSPDQRIVDGMREFYLGFLSKHLPHEAFGRVRSRAVTDTAMEVLRLTRAEIAADGTQAKGSTEARGDGVSARTMKE